MLLLNGRENTAGSGLIHHQFRRRMEEADGPLGCVPVTVVSAADAQAGLKAKHKAHRRVTDDGREG